MSEDPNAIVVAQAASFAKAAKEVSELVQLVAAIKWCTENRLPVQFGPHITVYDEFGFDLDILGEGKSIIEAVADAQRRQEQAQKLVEEK